MYMCHDILCMNLAIITPIPKSGDICNSDNYRNIALNSCIAYLLVE